MEMQVEDHLGLIHHVLRKYRNREEYEDLVQEAAINLMRAVEKYDPSVGTFSAYALHWIQQVITKKHAESKRHIRKANTEAISLFTPISEEMCILDSLSDKHRHFTEIIEAKVFLEDLLSTLSTQEQRILMLRAQGLLLREISQTMGVTLQRIQQIEKEAIQKLRTRCREQSLDN